MRELNINGLIFFVFLSILISCEYNREQNCPDCSAQPEIFRLKITDSEDSTDLIYNGYYDSDSVLIFYNDNGEKKYIETEIHFDTILKKSKILSHEISWKSSEGYKEYFLYLNFLDIDTIYFDAEKSPNDCCPFYSLIDFKINNIKIEIDTTDNIFNFKK